jgi:nucleoside phosphorylase
VIGPIAIVAALPGELSPMVDRCRKLTRVGRGKQVWRRGFLLSQPVVLAVTGDGARAAQKAIEVVLEAERPSRLLVLGVSGGLSPGLEWGGLYAADRVVSHENHFPGGEWSLEIARHSGVRKATIAAVDSILLDPESKARVWRELGQPEAAIADLESAVFAAAASRRSIPFGILRSVLDGARDTLPLDFNRCLGRDGRVSTAKVMVRMMAQRGGVLRRLLDLHERLRHCAEALAQATVGLVSEQGETEWRPVRQERATA